MESDELIRTYTGNAVGPKNWTLSLAEDNGACPFIEERADFLRRYWPERNEIADPQILAALAVAIGALNGDSGIKLDWTQLEFKNDIPEEEKYEGQYFCIGAGDNKNLLAEKNNSTTESPCVARMRHSAISHFVSNRC